MKSEMQAQVEGKRMDRGKEQFREAEIPYFLLYFFFYILHLGRLLKPHLRDYNREKERGWKRGVVGGSGE